MEKIRIRCGMEKSPECLSRIRNTGKGKGEIHEKYVFFIMRTIGPMDQITNKTPILNVGFLKNWPVKGLSGGVIRLRLIFY